MTGPVFYLFHDSKAIPLSLVVKAGWVNHNYCISADTLSLDRRIPNARVACQYQRARSDSLTLQKLDRVGRCNGDA